MTVLYPTASYNHFDSVKEILGPNPMRGLFNTISGTSLANPIDSIGTSDAAGGVFLPTAKANTHLAILITGDMDDVKNNNLSESNISVYRSIYLSDQLYYKVLL